MDTKQELTSQPQREVSPPIVDVAPIPARSEPAGELGIANCNDSQQPSLTGFDHEALRLPVDPVVDHDLYELLLAAARVDAHVLQTLDPAEPHVLMIYVGGRTSDADREALHMGDDGELPVAEWLRCQHVIVQEWFALEPQVRKAGILLINFNDEIAVALERIGITVTAWEDYIVPVAFEDLA